MEFMRIVSALYIGQVNTQIINADLGVYFCADTNELIVLNTDGETATVFPK
ncbi:hypothetical protein [Pseudodesulfovibrio senegalensis]|uniref:hypothetical protein n=1 Tax=Pseudodesulfovibrio senegalensis TaxID=1721087 RepID=UPI0013762918|nr:hypothetical protein [Pseudodesulfovibrio senegalensis]